MSIGTLIVFGTASQYIQRYLHLSTEHELEQVVPRGGMNTTAIGHQAGDRPSGKDRGAHPV